MSTHIIKTHTDPPHQQQSVNEIVTLDQSQAVLRQLVDSGFLALIDIGRLLICTSKSTTECLYNDDPNDLWIFLLKQRCSLKQDTLSASKMTAKEIFLSTFQKKSEKPPMQIRNLCYSPQDYLIIVNICEDEYDRTSMDGRSLFSRAIPGQEIPDFFERGCFSLKDVNLDLQGGLLYEATGSCFERIDLEINVHIHRIADNSVMNFLVGKRYHNGEWVFHLWKSELEMADLEYSLYLFEELMEGQGYVFETRVGLEFTDDGYTDYCDEVVGVTCDGSCYGCYGELVSITLETMILRKGTLMHRNDFCENIPGNQTVTFAHFLENMYAWDK